MADCTIERPDAQELWDKIEDEFSLTVLNGGDVIPESNEWYVVSLNFAMAKEFYTIAEMMWRERDPRYACCDNLYKIAAENGVYPAAAASAQGYVKITGDAGAALSQDITVEFDGNQYVASGTVPAALPSSGETVIRFMAVDPGPDGNNVSGTGTLVTELDGVDTEVTAYGTFCDGADEEDCESFRARYLERMAYTQNTNLKWIMDRAAEYPCVTKICDKADACCVLDSNGKPICSDRVELYAIFDGTFDCGLAPQCVIDDMNTWLFGDPMGYGNGQLPFGVCGEVLYVQPVLIDVSLDGFSCYTAAQREEIEENITEYFKSLCPSVGVTMRSIEAIVSQVVGTDGDWSVALNISDDNTECGTDCATSNLCGDIEIGCDYRACLNDINFVNMDLTSTGCF